MLDARGRRPRWGGRARVKPGVVAGVRGAVGLGSERGDLPIELRGQGGVRRLLLRGPGEPRRGAGGLRAEGKERDCGARRIGRLPADRQPCRRVRAGWRLHRLVGGAGGSLVRGLLIPSMYEALHLEWDLRGRGHCVQTAGWRLPLSHFLSAGDAGMSERAMVPSQRRKQRNLNLLELGQRDIAWHAPPAEGRPPNVLRRCGGRRVRCQVAEGRALENQALEG